MGYLKPDCLDLKVKRVTKEAKNAKIGGAGKVESVKGATDKQAHTILVNVFENFDTGDKDHFFFSHMFRKVINTPTSFLLLDSESSIKMISNKAMVTNIRRSPNLIILHLNAGL